MEWLRWSWSQFARTPMRPNEWSWPRWAGLGTSAFLVWLGVATWAGLAPDEALDLAPRATRHILFDRQGQPLAEDAGEWNVQNQVPLYRVPQRLKDAVLLAEDRRFFAHRGVDWIARAHGLWQGIRAGRNVRGASTITEQVVRMLKPRPRTLWSKWLEGFDARRLEARATKSDILEFYLNQVPYASNRRGVANAARFYFDRDLGTLDTREMIALAILPRAPSGLDPYRGGAKVLDRRSLRLATAMRHAGVLPAAEWQRAIETPLDLQPPPRRSAIGHFRNYVERQLSARTGKLPLNITTTLDSGLVDFAQGLLDERLASLGPRHVHNGALLVVDRRSGEIRAWVVAGADAGMSTPGRFLDAVLIPRQPGSALKPFLYAAAFDAGWSPAERIEDAPYSEAVGTGLHRFNNYSRQFYGEVSARQALGNSLNIPALHAVNFVGPDRYLDILHQLGFESLKKSAGFYGDGLALGNGEVSLLELVRGFTALANGGTTVRLRAIADDERRAEPGARVFSRDAALLVGNVLSDPWARVMEFGRYSTLNLPVQTAVKTGTSTDYRDAWSVGFDSRYVVGIWMGNLDQTPTDGITGSTGPALVLRGVFAYLNRDRNTGKLPLPADLPLADSCAFGQSGCEQIYDYKTNVAARSPVAKWQAAQASILTPTPNLRLAYDPRLPADRQMFRFTLGGVEPEAHVTWLLNGEPAGETRGPDFMWRLTRGTYAVEARVEDEDGARMLGPVAFSVR
ncbi:transglycosylase domain-containing protein [Parvibaculum sp.]|uniref:transglycosylase domain-containing protein n=1 Tax=Parvibaculum sp. TaxID=2024848 RepID=UPI002B95FCBA|nr:transglycosylase domain-containing protein [Parvibaculum sp.]HUD53500.1 transglycosylase domain-containing protein [Parvibaculum sp.]